jgi:hypothetical protein
MKIFVHTFRTTLYYNTSHCTYPSRTIPHLTSLRLLIPPQLMFFTTGWDLNGYYAMANVIETPQNWGGVGLTTVACILPVYAGAWSVCL